MKRNSILALVAAVLSAVFLNGCSYFLYGTSDLGVIGGADGPTAIVVGKPTDGDFQSVTAVSKDEAGIYYAQVISFIANTYNSEFSEKAEIVIEDYSESAENGIMYEAQLVLNVDFSDSERPDISQPLKIMASVENGRIDEDTIMFYTSDGQLLKHGLSDIISE